jgi:rhodanese-related sulfurtransferase
MEWKSVTVSLFFLTLLLGCLGKGEPPEHGHGEALKFFEISPLELAEELRKGEVKILDVRSGIAYAEGHIEGAVHLPLDRISQEALQGAGFSSEDSIVVYHTSGQGGEKAYNLLTALGYEDVRSLMGGYTHWIEDGYSVVVGKEASGEPVRREVGGPRIAFDRRSHDFGKIPQYGGIVSTHFTVRNEGEGVLEIGEVTTSCGCTKAEIGKTALGPGEETVLTVFFDPNFHEEPTGRFQRTVFLPTNDPTQEEAEVEIIVDVVEGE